MDIDNPGKVKQKFWKHKPQAWLFFIIFFFPQEVEMKHTRVQMKLQALRNTTNIEKVSVKEDLSRDNWGLKEFCRELQTHRAKTTSDYS